MANFNRLPARQQRRGRIHDPARSLGHGHHDRPGGTEAEVRTGWASGDLREGSCLKTCADARAQRESRPGCLVAWLPGNAWQCLAMPGNAWQCLAMPGNAWLLAAARLPAQVPETPLVKTQPVHESVNKRWKYEGLESNSSGAASKNTN